mgnify:CR=1 FL=1
MIGQESILQLFRKKNKENQKVSHICYGKLFDFRMLLVHLDVFLKSKYINNKKIIFHDLSYHL